MVVYVVTVKCEVKLSTNRVNRPIGQFVRVFGSLVNLMNVLMYYCYLLITVYLEKSV